MRPWTQLSRRIAGHAWTIAPTLRHRVAPHSAPPTVPWSAEVVDPTVGAVPITGLYREHPRSHTLVILVHGLGGNAEAAYVVNAAREVEAAGHSCLRLSMRGADDSGADFYYAGMTADLHAAITCPTFKDYGRIFVMGFSLGGHIALWLAAEGGDPRVRGVVAVSPPLDLAAGQRAIDRPERFVYREYVLRALNQSYALVDAAGRAPTPIERVRRAHTLREWDSLTVVPRFGFADVDDYYRRASVAPHLGALKIPSLIVAGRFDPMIPAAIVEPCLPENSDTLDVAWSEEGGHVFFPDDVDLGFGGRPGVVPQALQWLERQ